MPKGGIRPGVHEPDGQRVYLQATIELGLVNIQEISPLMQESVTRKSAPHARSHRRILYAMVKQCARFIG